MKHYFYSTTALVLCLIAPAAWAQGDENVIVTATRVPTPAGEIASSVTVIGADEITARQLRTLPDVLADVPGLEVVQTGAAGGQTSLFLRGTNSNHTKVLLDGIDLSDPSNPNGSADVSKLSTAAIARVEVLRGPQSGLYGSDAVGGVINIITKSGEGPLALSASAEGGSFDTFNQSASVSGSDGAFHYVATADHVHEGAVAVTPRALLLPGEARNDDYYDGLNLTTRLGYDVSGNFDLGLVGLYANSLGKITGDAFDPATFTSYPAPTRSRVDTLQYAARATAHLKLDGFDQTLGLAYGANATSDADPSNGYSLAAGNRIKLDWQGNAALAEGETLVLGAETARDAIHQPLTAGITTSAGFAELQSTLGALSNSVSLRYDDNSRYGDKFTWRVAPTYFVAATGTKLNATLGTGFKAPSLQDLYGPYGHNPNLKPETSIGYDLGVEQALGAAASVGVTWFHNDLKNLIDYDATFTPINIDKARTQGIESFVAWTPLDTLSLRADYTYTEAQNETLGVRLARRPADKASLRADWRPMPALSLDATLLAVGAADDIGRESFAALRRPGYTVVNLAASYRFEEGFTLFGRLDNAFDQHYQDPSGFQRPGVGAFAGIKATL